MSPISEFVFFILATNVIYVQAQSTNQCSLPGSEIGAAIMKISVAPEQAQIPQNVFSQYPIVTGSQIPQKVFPQNPIVLDSGSHGRGRNSRLISLMLVALIGNRGGGFRRC